MGVSYDSFFWQFGRSFKYQSATARLVSGSLFAISRPDMVRSLDELISVIVCVLSDGTVVLFALPLAHGGLPVRTNLVP